MSRTIKWTSDVVKVDGYYYYCRVNRNNVGVVYFEKGDTFPPDEVRSNVPITLPAFPRKIVKR